MRASLSRMSSVARTKLAARRLRSHSHGATAVSSKSLMSNTSRRSGVARPPKLSRWQSPHAWTCKPVAGMPARSSVITAAPEGEGRDLHAGIAQRQQVGQPRLALLDQDLDGVAAIGGSLPDGLLLA